MGIEQEDKAQDSAINFKAPDEKREIVKDKGVDWLKLEMPNERPWADKVDQFNSEAQWQAIYDKAVAQWDEQIVSTVEDSLTEQDIKDEGLKEELIHNAKTIIRKEALAILDQAIRGGSKLSEIENVIGDLNDSFDHNLRGLNKEIRVRQRLLQAGIQEGLQQNIITPQPDMMGELSDDEKLKGFVSDEAPLFFEGEQGQSRLDKIDDFRATLLKGHAAVGDALKKNNRLDMYNRRVMETASDISLGIENIRSRGIELSDEEKKELGQKRIARRGEMSERFAQYFIEDFENT